MQNENQSLIDDLKAISTSIEVTFKDYCVGRPCIKCNFNNGQKKCSYKLSSLLLIIGYRLATTDTTEETQIDAFLKDNYSSFFSELYKEIQSKL